MVNSYVEIVPRDVVKYELDKPSGHLRLDRPHKFSSVCPTLYGFVPQTYCGEKIAEFCMQKTGRSGTMAFIVIRFTMTNQRGETVALIDNRFLHKLGAPA